MLTTIAVIVIALLTYHQHGSSADGVDRALRDRMQCRRVPAPGREIEGPMVIIILGGLLTSTALNLLLPSLALRYGEFDRAESSDRQV
jgi:multidrug efflux pump subunit AcrB